VGCLLGEAVLDSEEAMFQKFRCSDAKHDPVPDEVRSTYPRVVWRHLFLEQ
jgi:hypothetical protein